MEKVGNLTLLIWLTKPSLLCSPFPRAPIHALTRWRRTMKSMISELVMVTASQEMVILLLVPGMVISSLVQEMGISFSLEGKGIYQVIGFVQQ